MNLRSNQFWLLNTDISEISAPNSTWKKHKTCEKLLTHSSTQLWFRYLQSVSFQYVSLFLKKPASRKYLPLGVLILDWWCVLKAWAVNVFGMVNLIEPRFWLGGFFVLVNSIKFDQSGAAGGSRSDTHRGVNTFEKLAFPKIKRHIGMKPIVKHFPISVYFWSADPFSSPQNKIESVVL